MRVTGPIASVGLSVIFTTSVLGQQADTPGFRVVRQGDDITLCSPLFSFHLSMKDGLRAESWENRLTGQRLSLGSGPEIAVEVGLPSQSVTAVQWLRSSTRLTSDTPGEVVVELAAENPRLTARIKYVWDAREPVLRKFVAIRNDGDIELDRLLNCRLGEYTLAGGTKITPASARGFPAYVADEYFLSLAHPSGFADVEANRITFRQYPGVRLLPKQTFQCMEAVYGVAPSDKARTKFVGYVRTRMRRVRRGHDKPYAILESFGGQPSGDFFVTEPYLLEHLGKVAQGMREGAPRFDFYCTEFWHDPAGDLTTFNPKGFPHGYGKVLEAILKLGMRPGLWIDSGGVPGWTIGQNPAVQDCFTKGRGKGEICRASEPINTMYKQAFIRLVREKQVGLLKFDNIGPDCQPPCCENPAHGHLPGKLYSVEAIHNALIDFYRELDSACPDVFLILYWGYRSPWWLEYGDTYFESGTHIEAASPAEFPAPHARDSVTQRLDQAQWLIVDTPWLGKDSLGVWLSDWPWNSGVGSARWQEGFIMDICRGSLLAQIWTDTDWLTPPERKQLADFIGLLKAHPDCFGNSRFMLGSPWKSEPYGYACGNGQRSFLAISNPCLRDNIVTIPLGLTCGLAENGRWDIYRWYPRPARLAGDALAHERDIRLAMRPYEVVLLEVVPAGKAPSLQREFTEVPTPVVFPEPSAQLDLKVIWRNGPPDGSSHWLTLRPISATGGKATLTVRDDGSIMATGENVGGDVYTLTAKTDLQSVSSVMLETLTDDSLPSHGPGRAVNGNFALAQFRLFAASADSAGEAAEIGIRTARADFSQTSHGGWPIAGAVDDNPSSAWSIHPYVGEPHAALFVLKTPVVTTGGTVLTFKLRQGENGHSLGRFRLSVSAEKSPLLPAAYAAGELEARTQLPPSRVGRTLLVVGEKGMEIPVATVGGKDVRLVPVWSDKSYWPCPWNAWRAEIDPAEAPRALWLSVATRQSSPRPSLKVYSLLK